MKSVPAGPIYVARFEGKTDFVDDATYMYVQELEKAFNRSVIQGNSIRKESSDIVGAGNIAQTDEALAKARQSKAELLILGKVTSYSNGETLNGFTTVRVFSVASGQRLATIHCPSGMLIGYSEHQGVMASAARTAKATSEALR